MLQNFQKNFFIFILDFYSNIDSMKKKNSNGKYLIILMMLLAFICMILLGLWAGRELESDLGTTSKSTGSAPADEQQSTLTRDYDTAQNTTLTQDSSAAQNNNLSSPTSTLDSSVLTKAQQSSVLIESGSLYGSGNIWKIDGDTITIITALHVIDDPSDIVVTFCDGTTAMAEQINSDDQKDYCFLMVKELSASNYSSIELSSDSLSPDTSVFMLENTTPQTATVGVISNPSIYSEDFSQEMIYCLISVSEGMSGTGLYDLNGRYLGILLGGTENGEAVCLSADKLN